ncbi:MAG: hypothetical protein IT458_13910 [Planctomycetes bacterium]|nr:hypothetical protein [Planctomycetota bacterium]
MPTACLIVLLLFLAARPSAQVPFGHLVTAESSGVDPGGSFVVWPGDGSVTPIRTPSGGGLGGCRSVAIDAADSHSIWLASTPGTGYPSVTRVGLAGSHATSFGGAVLAIPAPSLRLHVAGTEMLFTCPAGSSAGLWRMPLGSRYPRRVYSLTEPSDLTVLGTKAYVVLGQTGPASSIVEIDLISGISRTLGNGYPVSFAIGRLDPGVLLLGALDGGLWRVDPVNGAATLLLSTGVNPIVAVGGGIGTLPVYVATAANEILEVRGGSTRLVYRTSSTLGDFDVSELDTASLLAYGAGCPGHQGLVPSIEILSLPALGNASFALHVSQALPGASTAVALGASRTTFGGYRLPVDLGPIGMAGCALHTDVLLVLGQTIDAQGKGALRLPIPATPVLKGQFFTGQFFVHDPNANPLALATSEGVQGWMR